jgi:hypothetical protein
VDTYKSGVAEKALEHGAEIINDPSGLTFDAQLARVAASHNAALIINHMRGTPETWAKLPPLKDVIGAIRHDLDAAVHRAVRAGVERTRIAVDPGLGFGKRREQNAEILARLDEFAALELPIAVGPSRKSFLPPTEDSSAPLLQCATAAAVTAAILGGAHIASLAFRTVVRPALSHHDPADFRPASSTRLAGAPVNLMLQLEAPLFTVGIDVVRDRRAFQTNCRGEDVDHSAVQARGALLAQAGGDGPRMDARFEQRFVGVDIAHAAQKFLIQQQLLDPRVAFLEQLQEIFHRNVEGVRAQCPGPFRQTRAPFDTSEMSNVVIDQHSLIELEDRASVSGRLGIEQELSGHAKVNRQDAVVEFQDDKFAVSRYRFHGLVAQALGEHRELLSNNVVRKELCFDDSPPGEPGRQ